MNLRSAVLASTLLPAVVVAGSPANAADVFVEVIGAGSVISRSTAIDCPELCEATFRNRITLRAEPIDDSEFVGWIGDCAGSRLTCRITTRRNESFEVVAVFQSETAAAPVEVAGQTTTYLPGDDGDYQAGVPWPDPRFSDNEDGTVIDHLTGLVWLQDAACITNLNWAAAIDATNSLGDGDCSLTDFSEPGDWRLPNVKELLSLVDYGNVAPALPDDHPFLGVLYNRYWSATTFAGHVPRAWSVHLQSGLSDGLNYVSDKDGNRPHVYSALPVRDAYSD